MGAPRALIPRERMVPLDTIGEIFRKPKFQVKNGVKGSDESEKSVTPVKFKDANSQELKKSPFSKLLPSGLTFKARASPPGQRLRIVQNPSTPILGYQRAI